MVVESAGCCGGVLASTMALFKTDASCRFLIVCKAAAAAVFAVPAVPAVSVHTIVAVVVAAVAVVVIRKQADVVQLLRVLSAAILPRHHTISLHTNTPK